MVLSLSGSTQYELHGKKGLMQFCHCSQPKDTCWVLVQPPATIQRAEQKQAMLIKLQMDEDPHIVSLTKGPMKLQLPRAEQVDT